MTGFYNRRDAGFTLLEMLVSLALLTLLLALMPPALRLARKGPAIATELERRSADEAAMSFIVQRLAEATPVYRRGDDGRLQIQFDGQPGRIGFIAPLRFDAASNGLARFDLAIGTGADGQQGLIMSWTPWQPKNRDASAAGTSEATLAPPTGKLRLMIPGAPDLRLRYFGALRSREAPGWASAWTRTDALPTLLELTVPAPTGLRQRVVHLQLNLP